MPSFIQRLHQDQLSKYETYKANIKTQNSKKRKCVENNYEEDSKHPPKISQNTLFDYMRKSRRQLQAELDENIVNYIVDSMKPLPTVEETGFKKIIQGE